MVSGFFQESQFKTRTRIHHVEKYKGHFQRLSYSSEGGVKMIQCRQQCHEQRVLSQDAHENEPNRKMTLCMALYGSV